jgi:hypothetical protein
MGHACIALDFKKGMPHGHFCLKDASAGCMRPFFVPVNKPSLSGKAATNYCGIDEDQATCEAVLAMVAAWDCAGMNGKCTNPNTMQEVDVPGALCKKILGTNSCTYACAGAVQCPNVAPQNTCGDGMGAMSGWCGG